jgi:malate dehydrogenase (oxaloacetate-decarboxylating)(NADP+)
MMLAATRALADLAREEVPDAVRGAYEGSEISFGPEYLIPKPFDHRVLFHVAPAVADGRDEDRGSARGSSSISTSTRDRLRASLGSRPRGHALDDRPRSKEEGRGWSFPKGHNDTVIQAAAQMVEDGICQPVLLARPPRIAEKGEDARGRRSEGIEIYYAAELDKKRRPGVRRAALQEAWVAKGSRSPRRSGASTSRSTIAASLLEDGRGGCARLRHRVELRRGPSGRVSHVIGPKRGGNGRVAGLYMLAFPNRELLFFADTTVNIEPDARALAEIAVQSATFVSELGIKPRVAMVTFSNFGSSQHDEARRVAAAVDMVRTMPIPISRSTGRCRRTPRSTR